MLETTIKIDNQTISYYDNNNESKKIIFFAHGWAADKDNLKSIYTPLNNDFRIISIDLPGFGKSTIPETTFGSTEYAKIIFKFLKKLNINTINYTGHSFGGKIGIILSVLYPEMIKRLILIDSSGLRPRRYPDWYIKVYSYKLLKFFYMKILKKPYLVEKLKNKAGSDDYKNSGAMRNIMVKTVNEDITPMLEQIKCPVFLYWGEKDKATPLWMAKKMEKKINDSALYIVKNGTHFSFLQDNSIIEILKSFAV